MATQICGISPFWPIWLVEKKVCGSQFLDREKNRGFHPFSPISSAGPRAELPRSCHWSAGWWLRRACCCWCWQSPAAAPPRWLPPRRSGETRRRSPRFGVGGPRARGSRRWWRPICSEAKPMVVGLHRNSPEHFGTKSLLENRQKYIDFLEIQNDVPPKMEIWLGKIGMQQDSNWKITPLGWMVGHSADSHQLRWGHRNVVDDEWLVDRMSFKRFDKSCSTWTISVYSHL